MNFLPLKPLAVASGPCGAVGLDVLITHHFSLEETPKAFELQMSRRDGVIKAVIEL